MKITLSKSQWEFIGNKTGWIKTANKPRIDVEIDDMGRRKKIWRHGELCPKCGKPMQKHPLSKTHEQYKDIKQCPYCFLNYSPHGTKYEGSAAWEQEQKRKSLGQQAQLIINTYFYHINLDERGEFYADVRKNDKETVFEIKGFDIFEDGFMKNSEDMVGLKEYLISLGIMDEQDELKYVG